MKKFYIPIFTAVFLLTSFLSNAQTIYRTIPNDNTYHSLNSPATWLPPNGQPPLDPGGIPAACINCDITIDCLATLDFFAGGFSYVEVKNSKVTLTPGNSLTVRNAFRFTNSFLNIGTDAVGHDTLFAYAQMYIDANSTVTLANPFTYISTLYFGLPFGYSGNIYNYFAPTGPPNTLQPGLFQFGNYPGYGPYPGDPNGAIVYQFSYLLVRDDPYGTPDMTVVPPFYNFNCTNGVGSCGSGIVNGPATTTTVPDIPSAVNPQPPPRSHLEFKVSAILPVQLVQFLANKNPDGSVKVIWATSQEENASYYDVERTGEQPGWLKLATVRAKGNSSTTTNYNFLDGLPLDGTAYYRLKMVDLDGKFKYSKTVSVSSAKTSLPLVIYSNPFSDQIRFKVNVSRAQNLVISVSDMLGKTYINKSYQAQSGDNFVYLQPGVGGTGMYILHIHGESYDQTVKLEKQ